MMRFLTAIAIGLMAIGSSAEATNVAVGVEPKRVVLDGPVSRYSLLVTGTSPTGQLADLTREATYRSAAPSIVTVNEAGVLRPVASGSGRVIVNVAGRELSVDVDVRDAEITHQFSFTNDVMPLLDKYGCNGAGCHGKAEGQGGLKLSVFNSDPRADFTALTTLSRGRRVSPAAPKRSLLLLKATNTWPHGGGSRFAPASHEFETLRAWIEAGVPYESAGASEIVDIRVTPENRVLPLGEQQQLRVVAQYADGSERDVTHLSLYSSNSVNIATVSKGGLVGVQDRPGQAAVMASFLNRFAVFQVLVPRPELITEFPEFPENNFIDPLVSKRLRALNVQPSGLSDDAEYLRRIFLDLIGTLPTAREAQRFMKDPRPDRRARAVEQLLKRPEYADYWALRWADVLRVNRQKLGHENAYNFYKWIRESFAINKPYDRFVRELLTVRGSLVDKPQGYFFKAGGGPGKIASDLSQTFLGLRIGCAECHHHPNDVWSQTDYFGMVSFFTQVTYKGTPRGELIFTAGAPQTKHPRSGEVVFPHPLGTKMPESAPPGDRRTHLADWLINETNPWFAKNVVNRMWAHLMGRGLIEPVDDLRATNPPTNPELLDALTRHFVSTGYNLKRLIRTITASRAYQLSAIPNETNRNDEQSYSRAILRPLEAEVLLDAVCQATGVNEKFEGIPAGYRAIQLWDSSLSHYFLKVFGRPERKSACVCERVPDASVSQVLHLLNSPEIQAKLASDDGNVARFVTRHRTDEALVDELYLTFFSRYPERDERERALAYFDSAADRRLGAEDLAWSMLCSLEFGFRH